MKKIIFSALLVIFGYLNITAQVSKKLPAYYIVGSDTIGIVVSVEQAQRIDNDLELLSLLKSKGVKCDSVIGAYVSVVNESERQIGILNIKISSLEDINEGQNHMIGNLKRQIENYKEDLSKSEMQSRLKDDIIKSNEKEIKRLKVKNKLFLGGGILSTIFAFVLGVIVSK